MSNLSQQKLYGLGLLIVAILLGYLASLKANEDLPSYPDSEQHEGLEQKGLTYLEYKGALAFGTKAAYRNDSKQPKIDVYVEDNLLISRAFIKNEGLLRIDRFLLKESGYSSIDRTEYHIDNCSCKNVYCNPDLSECINKNQDCSKLSYKLQDNPRDKQEDKRTRPYELDYQTFNLKYYPNYFTEIFVSKKGLLAKIPHLKFAPDQITKKYKMPKISDLPSEPCHPCPPGCAPALNVKN